MVHSNLLIKIIFNTKMRTSILSTLSIQKIIIGIENLKFSPLVDHKYFALPETISSYYGKYIRKIPKVPFKVLDAPQL